MRGCIQIYTGPGKGKTTAALGLAVRAAGAGFKVFIGQFLKKGGFSELKSLRRIPGIVVRQFGCGPFIRGAPTPAEIRAAQRGLARLRSAMLGGRFGLVIADEANCAAACGLLAWRDLVQLAEDKPDPVELVFTGRGAHRSLIRRADLVSVIEARKHPYASGLRGRRGIEW